MTQRVIRADAELHCDGIDDGLRARGVDLALTPAGMAEAEFGRAVRDADLVLTCYQPITEDVIRSAPRLRGIIKYGVGIDAIDIEAARRHRVPVVNVPAYAEETVAEAALALLLALAKKIVPVQQEVMRHGWAWPEPRWLGADVSGKVLGLVGVGRIGRAMARMVGPGFRMRVLGYDPYVSAAEMGLAGVERRADLPGMLAACDFVSLHAVLTPRTRHLIGAAELARMKPSAFLINVSRGALVDEAALVHALHTGRIAGAALDAYGHEPLARAGHPLSPLFGRDNVILSPHLAFYTAEAMHRLAGETLRRCDEILRGDPVLVTSADPRLTAQTEGVVFGG